MREAGGILRQRGLIHLDGVAIEQPRIRRHDVAQAQANNVAGHQFTSRRFVPFTVPVNAGLDRQLSLQGCDGITRLMFFPEAYYGIGQNRVRMIARSGQCLAIAERMTAASIIHGIGPQRSDRNFGTG